jgi:hypothetical protein
MCGGKERVRAMYCPETATYAIREMIYNKDRRGRVEMSTTSSGL